MAVLSLQDIQRVISGIITRIRKLEIQGNGGVIKTGLSADRPGAPTISSGTSTSYYAYDTKTLSIWNVISSDWDEVVLS